MTDEQMERVRQDARDMANTDILALCDEVERLRERVETLEAREEQAVDRYTQSETQLAETKLHFRNSEAKREHLITRLNAAEALADAVDDHVRGGLTSHGYLDSAVIRFRDTEGERDA